MSKEEILQKPKKEVPKTNSFFEEHKLKIKNLQSQIEQIHEEEELKNKKQMKIINLVIGGRKEAELVCEKRRQTAIQLIEN